MRVEKKKKKAGVHKILVFHGKSHHRKPFQNLKYLHVQYIYCQEIFFFSIFIPTRRPMKKQNAIISVEDRIDMREVDKVLIELKNPRDGQEMPVKQASVKATTSQVARNLINFRTTELNPPTPSVPPAFVINGREFGQKGGKKFEG